MSDTKKPKKIKTFQDVVKEDNAEYQKHIKIGQLQGFGLHPKKLYYDMLKAYRKVYPILPTAVAEDDSQRMFSAFGLSEQLCNFMFLASQSVELKLRAILNIIFRQYGEYQQAEDYIISLLDKKIPFYKMENRIKRTNEYQDNLEDFMENLTFSEQVLLFDCLPKDDQKIIAKEFNYGKNIELCTDHLNIINRARNSIYHHRWWDLDKPEEDDKNGKYKEDRKILNQYNNNDDVHIPLYNLFCIINDIIHPPASEHVWKIQFVTYCMFSMQKPDTADIMKKMYGFPEGWFNDKKWQFHNQQQSYPVSKEQKIFIECLASIQSVFEQMFNEHGIKGVVVASGKVYDVTMVYVKKVAPKIFNQYQALTKGKDDVYPIDVPKKYMQTIENAVAKMVTQCGMQHLPNFLDWVDDINGYYHEKDWELSNDRKK